MLCPVCHKEIRETDHICPFCATPLTRYGTRMPALPESERFQAQCAQKKAHRRFLVLAGLGAGALGILGCMVLSAALGSMDLRGLQRVPQKALTKPFWKNTMIPTQQTTASVPGMPTAAFTAIRGATA